MKFGIGIPNAREGVFYPPGFCNASQLVELTLLAESLGFDSIWATDFMSPVPEIGIPAGRNPAWYELMVTLSYLAGVTERIKLGAGVAVLPFRDPIVLAKQAATLDHFSGGRFILGAGAGVFKTELRAIQGRLQKPHRGRMLDEHLQALNLLLNTEGRVSFSGEYYQFTNVELDPKPVQKPHPPVILGTFGSKWGRKRVAEFGDGWIPIDGFHGDLAADIADLKARLVEQGRDPESVPISMFDVFETSAEDLKRFADLGCIERAIPRCPTEDRDTVLRWLDKYAEIGRQIGAI